MKCSNCGTENKAGAGFCKNCGSKLKEGTYAAPLPWDAAADFHSASKAEKAPDRKNSC